MAEIKIQIATERTLHEAAAAHREPFIFHAGEVTEPLRKSLERLYKAEGKDFLLAPNGWSGVYPGEAHWLIPQGVGPSWMRKHLSDLIAETDLFPGRADSGNIFFHSGDLGDICAMLPAVRQLGGGKIIIGHQEGVGNREPMKGARFESLKPLLEIQPYITGVEYDDDASYATHNMALFRHDFRRWESLAHWQGRHVGITSLNVEPWLEVGDVEKHGKVVISRSHRCHNPFFPWDELIGRHRHKVVFVGLESERAALQTDIGSAFTIPYQPTENLLDLARFIAGSSLCIMNQSCPFWLAIGLGVDLIQETSDDTPNSIIERSNAIYTRTGPETRTLIFRLNQAVMAEK